MPTPYRQAEGNTAAGVDRKSADDPARSKTLRMSGSLLHGTREISSAPGGDRVGWGRPSRNPTIDADEKSDAPIGPEKRPNNGDCPAEVVEGRGAAEGSAGETPTHRTRSRGRVSMGLEGVREAARRCASRHDPRQEPYAVVPLVRICAGGGGQPPSLPRPPVSSPPMNTSLSTLTNTPNTSLHPPGAPTSRLGDEPRADTRAASAYRAIRRAASRSP